MQSSSGLWNFMAFWNIWIASWDGYLLLESSISCRTMIRIWAQNTIYSEVLDGIIPNINCRIDFDPWVCVLFTTKPKPSNTIMNHRQHCEIDSSSIWMVLFSFWCISSNISKSTPVSVIKPSCKLNSTLSSISYPFAWGVQILEYDGDSYDIQNFNIVCKNPSDSMNERRIYYYLHQIELKWSKHLHWKYDHTCWLLIWLLGCWCHTTDKELYHRPSIYSQE